jgi:hypothetical protein
VAGFDQGAAGDLGKNRVIHGSALRLNGVLCAEAVRKSKLPFGQEAWLADARQPA